MQVPTRLARPQPLSHYLYPRRIAGHSLLFPKIMNSIRACAISCERDKWGLFRERPSLQWGTREIRPIIDARSSVHFRTNGCRIYYNVRNFELYSFFFFFFFLNEYRRRNRLTIGKLSRLKLQRAMLQPSNLFYTKSVVII